MPGRAALVTGGDQPALQQHVVSLRVVVFPDIEVDRINAVGNSAEGHVVAAFAAPAASANHAGAGVVGGRYERRVLVFKRGIVAGQSFRIARFPRLTVDRQGRPGKVDRPVENGRVVRRRIRLGERAASGDCPAGENRR